MSSGKTAQLPDPRAFEDAVDAKLLEWPPGFIDSIGDLVQAPRQIPSAFTWENYPYSFSGPFMAGPFRGLSSQNNNIHGLNSDPFTQANQSLPLFKIDTELYYAILLQNAADKKFRFDPASGLRPSEFFKSIDPTPAEPGMNKMIALPSYPKASVLEPTGLLASDDGHKVWEKINAISAWENTLKPPHPDQRVDHERALIGKEIFTRAQCGVCHQGPALTNHKIIPVEEIKTQPIRAKGLRNAGKELINPEIYAFDQDMPLPKNPRTLPVPTSLEDVEAIKLAYAIGNEGGYKVPGLVGLYWSAPYLHDGGVAVGPHFELGVSATLIAGIYPDPGKSLRALVDRDLRARVIKVNASDPRTRASHIEGIGHEFWVDAAAGYSSEDQDALLYFLLTFEPEERS
jgi:hypothetical protein